VCIRRVRRYLDCFAPIVLKKCEISYLAKLFELQFHHQLHPSPLYNPRCLICVTSLLSGDISEYLVEMADMIEMENAPDDEIFGSIDAFLTILAIWRSRRRPRTSYDHSLCSKVGDVLRQAA
jgi:hypothetical protein